MAQQTNTQIFTDPSLETSKAPPNLAESADDPALTTKSATTYNSLPLTHSKSTRVLRILPSKSDQTDTIHIELQTISLDAVPPPDFCALSYIWGSPSETRCIVVNNNPFLARKNLWNFLDLMRRRDFSDLLWIDATCINQDCIPERNHQVSVMGDIYKGATRVIAWLGPESELVPCDEEMSDEPEMEDPTMERYSQAPLFDSIRLVHDNLSEFQKDVQREAEAPWLFRLLFQKMKEPSYAEYWSRIWIVQEYTLARDVTLLTDRSLMNGKDFLDIYKENVEMLSYGFKIPFDIPWQKVGLTPMIQLMESSNDNLRLQELIYNFRNSKCIDPRDHVYALLSLVKPKSLLYHAIHPDYSKSELQLFAELLYKLFGRGWIRMGPNGRRYAWMIRQQRRLAESLDIESTLATKLMREIVAKLELEDELGRQRWDEKVAEEIAQLTLTVEQSPKIKESGSDIDTTPC